MNWKVEFDEKAKDDFLKLDKQAQNRIAKFIEERLLRRQNPRELGASLKGDLSGFWKYRVGDYRLVCQIEDSTITVLVVAIGHRKDIYKF